MRACLSEGLRSKENGDGSKEIIELMKAMSENGMTGFELAEGDWKLTMKREKKVVAAAQTPVVMQVPGQGSMIQAADVTVMEQVSGENAEKKISGISEKVITCPLVGTFYSSPAPDAEDYVKVGGYREKKVRSSESWKP